jgi:hypothetical protein
VTVGNGAERDAQADRQGPPGVTDAAGVDRTDGGVCLGAGHQHGLLGGARRGGGAAAAVAAAPVPVAEVAAARPALAWRIRGRDRRLADVRGGAAAGAARAGAGGDRVRGRGPGVRHRAWAPVPAGPARAGRRRAGRGRADPAGAVAGRDGRVRSASGGRRRHHLARCVRRRRGAAHRRAGAPGPRRIARPGRRLAVRRRRHLGQAGRLRRAVAGRAGPVDPRLRHRDERAAVGLPAGRRADGGRPGDHGDQRGPDRDRVRAVRRDTAARDARRPADRGVRVPGGERGRARAPAGAAGQQASSARSTIGQEPA